MFGRLRQMWHDGVRGRVYFSLAQPWLVTLLFGICLIALGILIALVPPLLAVIVAGGLIFAGLMVIGIAWNAWRFSRGAERFSDRFPF